MNTDNKTTPFEPVSKQEFRQYTECITADTIRYFQYLKDIDDRLAALEAKLGS